MLNCTENQDDGLENMLDRRGKVYYNKRVSEYGLKRVQFKGDKMIMRKNFFSIIVSFFLAFVLGGSLFCCRKEVEEKTVLSEYFDKQGSLKFDENISQRYKVTSTFYNRDMDGNIVSSMQITARFERSVENGEVLCEWSDVRLFSTRDTSLVFPKGKPLDYMEEFSYALSEEILTEEFYRDFPEEDRAFMKALIWDAPWIEVAYVAVDNIEYDKAYFSTELEQKEVKAQNFALLKTKNLKLQWTGIAKKENENCALLEFKSLSNPVTSKTDILSVRGRSCCWGSFWVSLEDHQVEHVVTNEDIVIEMSVSGNPLGGILNMQREVVFDKLE